MIYNIKLIIAVLLIIAALGGVLYFEIQSHGATKEELKSLETTVALMQNSIDTANSSRLKVDKKVNAIATETSYLERELSQYRDREKVVLAKPGLVELKINKSFNKYQKSLACETGDTLICQ
jgi:septal ring factor EnvC (AmiA/AmiB activator)